MEEGSADFRNAEALEEEETSKMTTNTLNSFQIDQNLNEPPSVDNIGKVIYLSICFLILLIGDLGSQYLVVFVYEDLGYGYLGQLTFMMFSISASLSIVFYPQVIKDWSYKKTLIIGSIGHFLFVFAGFVTTSCGDNESSTFLCENDTYIYAFNLIAGLVNGFAWPFFSFTGKEYVAACSNASNRQKYMQYFATSFYAAYMFGAVIAFILVQELGVYGFYLRVIILAGIGLTMFFFIPNIPKLHYYESEQISKRISKLIGSALGAKMRPLILTTIYMGILMAIYHAFDYKIIFQVTDSVNQEEFIITLVYLRFIQAVVSYFGILTANLLFNKTKRVTALSSLNLLSILTILLGLFAYWVRDETIAKIMASILSSVSYCGTIIIALILTKDFEGDSFAEGAYYLIMFLAAAFWFGLCILLEASIELFLILILFVLIINQISIRFYNP